MSGKALLFAGAALLVHAAWSMTIFTDHVKATSAHLSMPKDLIAEVIAGLGLTIYAATLLAGDFKLRLAAGEIALKCELFASTHLRSLSRRDPTHVRREPPPSPVAHSLLTTTSPEFVSQLFLSCIPSLSLARSDVDICSRQNASAITRRRTRSYTLAHTHNSLTFTFFCALQCGAAHDEIWRHRKDFVSFNNRGRALARLRAASTAPSVSADEKKRA
jgi:hypothetical protein